MRPGHLLSAVMRCPPWLRRRRGDRERLLHRWAPRWPGPGGLLRGQGCTGPADPKDWAPDPRRTGPVAKRVIFTGRWLGSASATWPSRDLEQLGQVEGGAPLGAPELHEPGLLGSAWAACRAARPWPPPCPPEFGPRAVRDHAQHGEQQPADRVRSWTEPPRLSRTPRLVPVRPWSPRTCAGH